MTVVIMTRAIHTNGDDVWKLHIGNIDKSNSPDITIYLHEADAEKLKPHFSHCKKSGRFNENKKYI